MTTSRSTQNQLLALLPAPVAETVVSRLDLVHLEGGQVLAAAGQPLPAVYFPKGCLISALVHLSDGRLVEVGMVGSEGFAGLPVLLQTDPAPQTLMCQVGGDALTMTAARFATVIRRTPDLRALLYKYAGLRLIESGRLLACNALHPLGARLARRLLMTQDRIGSDQFELTQDFLARMLVVRRPYLNSAARALQRNGWIRYRRGQITVVDRAGLETTTCEDYRMLQAEYGRLFSRVAPS
jgi:CRP-like cAMP-binding protein